MLAAPRPYRDGAFGNGVALHHAGRGRQSSATQLRGIAADQAVSLAIHQEKWISSGVVPFADLASADLIVDQQYGGTRGTVADDRSN
jgi:hypothetical protein